MTDTTSEVKTEGEAPVKETKDETSTADDTSTDESSTDSDDSDASTKEDSPTDSEDDSVDSDSDSSGDSNGVVADVSTAAQTPPVHVDPVAAAKNGEAARTAVPTSTAFDPGQADQEVTFHLNTLDTKTRTFNEEQHGSSWKDIAAEFFGTNKHKVREIQYS